MLADERDALQTTTGAALLVDADGRLVAGNESVEVVFRCDRDRIVDRSLPDLVEAGYLDPEVTDKYDGVLRTLETDERASFRTSVSPRESTDEYRYSVRVARVADDGEFVGTRWLLRDLGTRHRYDDTIDSLHVATRDLMAADSEIEVFNITGSAANGILGFPGVGVRTYDPEEHVLRHVAFGGVVADIDTRPPYDVSGTPHGRAFRTGETVVVPVPEDEDDPFGREVFSHVMYVPIGEYGVLSIGRIGGEFGENDRQFAEILAENAAAALRSVRQRDRLTAQREQLRQQNERLDRFASAVSHDLRNPLTVARGALERYRETGDESALDDVAYGHERMADIIDDVLTLARADGDVDATERLGLAPIAEDAWAGVDTDDLSLSVRTDATVEADPGRLRRLLENLFRNAAEHADGATVVRVGDVDDADGFSVADDGPGFPDDDVFEHGYTTAEEGTGFGLAIVEELAGAHGWSITGTDSVEGGARVEVTGVDSAD